MVSVLKATISLEMQKLRAEESSLEKAVGAGKKKKKKTPLSSLKAIKKFTSLENINAGGVPPARSVAGHLADKLTTPLAVRRKKQQMNRVKKMYDVGSVRRKMIQVKSIYEYLEREGPKSHKIVLQQLHEVDDAIDQLYTRALRDKHAKHIKKQNSIVSTRSRSRSLSIRSLPMLSKKSSRSERAIHSAEKLERQSKSFVLRRPNN